MPHACDHSDQAGPLLAYDRLGGPAGGRAPRVQARKTQEYEQPIRPRTRPHVGVLGPTPHKGLTRTTPRPRHPPTLNGVCNQAPTHRTESASTATSEITPCPTGQAAPINHPVSIPSGSPPSMTARVTLITLCQMTSWPPVKACIQPSVGQWYIQLRWLPRQDADAYHA